MFYENNFTEENYQLNVAGEQQEVYMISFWLNEHACFRVYVNGGEGNLFTWDEPSATLQQMDGQAAVNKNLHKALTEKISKSVVLPTA